MRIEKDRKSPKKCVARPNQNRCRLQRDRDSSAHTQNRTEQDVQTDDRSVRVITGRKASELTQIHTEDMENDDRSERVIIGRKSSAYRQNDTEQDVEYDERPERVINARKSFAHTQKYTEEELQIEDRSGSGIISWENEIMPAMNYDPSIPYQDDNIVR